MRAGDDLLGEDHEEHENHERWLVTYADMITLLMVLFIVLFAIGQTDLAKFEKLREGLAQSFGGDGVLEGSTAALPGGELAATPVVASPIGAPDTQRALQETLVGSGLSHSVSVRLETRGLVVSIAADRVLFDPARVDLRPEGRAIIDQLAPVLLEMPNPLGIEGHTDDLPISGAFPSNWELSTARASAVLRALIAHGIPASRLSAAGFADQRPVASNADAAGRSRNRRVEIVVLAPGPSREES